jgi:hypothetical protein
MLECRVVAQAFRFRGSLERRFNATAASLQSMQPGMAALPSGGRIS